MPTSRIRRYQIETRMSFAVVRRYMRLMPKTCCSQSNVVVIEGFYFALPLGGTVRSRRCSNGKAAKRVQDAKCVNEGCMEPPKSLAGMTYSLLRTCIIGRQAGTRIRFGRWILSPTVASRGSLMEGLSSELQSQL
ncbi:hypothetical protein BAUCODRAFT_541452 [Baudoinia panamericana UAMH 10762]|uniref:Uncharacterized protein n=1 Tax=Baudoinia panamericana (strain UAMH 10762) TaxID=717646 RepID=M2MFJ1_BAUPA|nr:uncharacterized protein BAUCODRAFT_541452 [Baudoinia panamericana UAMH 10762]EMC95421.1 hypothetical protein BAUCODRAFT_541452 [Baudoinia panamericana UAMH 10762]